jgi:hypothetical protein
MARGRHKLTAAQVRQAAEAAFANPLFQFFGGPMAVRRVQHLARREGVYYVRVPVPKDLVTVIGRRQSVGR